MANELTFYPGRVPGLPQAPRLRRTPPSEEPGMTLDQRAALAALIHVPARPRSTRVVLADLAAGVAWMLVTACALAWTLAIAVELAPDLRFARSTAMPHEQVAAIVVGPASTGLDAQSVQAAA